MNELITTTVNVAIWATVMFAIIVILVSKQTPKPPGPRFG